MPNNSSSSLDMDLLYSQAVEVSQAPGFQILLILETIVAIISLLPNGLLLYVLFCTSIFPVNLRLLLGHLSLNLLWYAIAFGIKAITILTTLTPESLIVNAYLCKASELSNTIPLQNTVYTSLALCLERMYSTVFYRQYEKQHSKPYLAIVSIPVAWILTLSNQLNSLFTIEHDRGMPICESLLSATPNSAMFTLSLSLICESLCVILILIVYLWNNVKLKHMTINRAQQSLGARFQISQNVQVSSMIMPSMILQAICYLPNYVFLFFVIFGLDESHFHIWLRVILIHCNYLWKLIYALLHPLVAFLSKARLFDHLKKHSSFIRFCNKTLVSRIKPKNGGRNQKPEDAAAHFQVLAHIWNQEEANKAQNKKSQVTIKS